MEVDNISASSDKVAALARLTTSVDRLNLQRCDVTQVGDLIEYRGDISVRHVVEIEGTGENLPSTSSARLPPVVLSAVHGQFPALDGIPQHYGSINRVFNDEDITVSRGHSQVSPLLNKTENQGSKSRWRCVAVTLVTFILILVLTLTAAYGHISKDPDDDNLPPNFKHIYRERAQWYAVPPKATIPSFSYLPPKFVVVSDTGTQPCNTTDQCSVVIRNLQAAQLAGSFEDICYNFLVGGDGLIYEGRGWMLSSASTPGMSCSALAVAFVGTFSKVQPPQQQLDAFLTLLDTAENYGKLKRHYEMFMQSDVTSRGTVPGRVLMDLLHQYPHSTVFRPQYLLC